MLSAYPLIFVIAGFVSATMLYRRAVALLSADAKAALIASSSSTKSLNLLIIAVFLALELWRPAIGWMFLGCAYLGLLARSVVRLRRLNLPARAARLILIGNVAAVVGLTLCASIFALRALP
jgi:hypothetical protein